MEKLQIAGTAKTPVVELNANGILKLEGRSIPENSIEFYRPVMEWLTEYAKKPESRTELNVKLEYFNTSSSKCILDLFKKLTFVSEAGSDVVVNWFYREDDEDILEAGEDYKGIVKIPFELLPYEE